jgi:hypothetical protein
MTTTINWHQPPSGTVPLCLLHTIPRGKHLKRYSVILITLRYVFVLSHNALTLLRSINTSIIYRTGHIGAVIAYYIY